jgi:4-carboxymuconolactone decarboxylase
MVPEQLRDAFDEVVTASPPNGPSSIAIHSPEFARRRLQVSDYLRFETAIPERILELALLVTARSMDCPYVWNAHAAAARNAGVSDAVVAAIRDKQPLPSMPADQSAIVSYGMELFRTHRVTQETFQAALDQFGSLRLVELTAIMGHYVQNAFFLNAFAVDLPDQGDEPLLPVE